MEELDRIKHHINLQRKSSNDDKRRKKSSAEAQNGKRLIQRVILAAQLASEKSKTCQEKHLNQTNASESKSERKESLVLKDVAEIPEIYVESDIDGLCYIGGPRRKSLKDNSNNNNNNT